MCCTLVLKPKTKHKSIVDETRKEEDFVYSFLSHPNTSNQLSYVMTPFQLQRFSLMRNW